MTEPEEKVNTNLLYSHFFVVSKHFLNTFAAFVKPFKVPQKGMKIKIYIIFYFI